MVPRAIGPPANRSKYPLVEMTPPAMMTWTTDGAVEEHGMGACVVLAALPHGNGRFGEGVDFSVKSIGL